MKCAWRPFLVRPPYLVGKAIQEIAKDKEILNTVFEILETEKLLDGEVELTLVPRDNLIARLLARGAAPGLLFPPQAARRAQRPEMLLKSALRESSEAKGRSLNFSTQRTQSFLN